jgi:long-subunit acyl-CoA synthetase (AMP-forming)
MQDVKKIMEDLAELKPTVFVAVPRVFDRIYSGLLQLLRLHWNIFRRIEFLWQ